MKQVVVGRVSSGRPCSFGRSAPHDGKVTTTPSRVLVGRCHAFPSNQDELLNAVTSLPSAVSSLLPDEARSQLASSQAHFGSRILSSGLDSLASRASAALPQLPLTAASGATSATANAANASATGGDAAGLLSNTLSALASAAQGLEAPTLPALDVSSALSAGLDLGAAAAAALAGSASASVAPGGAAAQLSAALASAASAAADGASAAVPAHFGTAAAARGLEAVAGWVGAQVAGVETLEPGTAAALTSALGELRSAAGLMTLPPALGAAGGASLQQLGAALGAAAAGLRGGAAGVQDAAAAAGGALGPDAVLSALAAAWEQAQTQGIGGHSPATVAVAVALSAAAIAASTPPTGYTGPESPEEPLSREYDPDAVAAYFSRRPLAVLRRSVQVAAEAAAWGAALGADAAAGRIKENEAARAEQLRGVIERLGPAYVKVAQALSTRADLLSPAYLAQIERLQDRVPPFPCDEARAAMEKAFARPVGEVFAVLSDKPVAAASLGQVYRGTLLPALGGGEVAVKVQRPGVLEQVALDLLIMRTLAVEMKKKLNLPTDWAAIIDAWAVRFFHELDYYREATNAETFEAQMREAGVKGVVVAAVVRPLSTDAVLTTEWVEGEKLSESAAADVRELCSTLLNAYLVQLLDTGLLHADPHPGNLIRTPDGKICVLDFGLVTEVTPEQRLALVEYIAHLSTQDWPALARDLQTLGFIPPEIDTQQAGLIEPLGRVMVQLTGGGGAAKVNIDKVAADLEELGKLYPIQVPAFFALILRAFSVIEGIALRVDPDYAIVAECFPYLTQRLLADDSPRMRTLLRELLYGPGRQRMDAGRILRLADGLGAFTTAGLGAQSGGGGMMRGLAAQAGVKVEGLEVEAARPAAVAVARAQEGPLLSPAAVDALRALLRPGSYGAELLAEEMAAAVDALGRQSASTALAALLASPPAAAASAGLAALGPLRPLLLPLPTPLELLSRAAPAVAVTPEDAEALGVVRALTVLSQRLAEAEAAASAAPSSPASPAVSASSSSTALVPQPAAVARAAARAANSALARPERTAALARELGGLLPVLGPGLASAGDVFVRALVRRGAARAREAAALVRSGSGAMGVGGRVVSNGTVAAVEVESVVPAIAMRAMEDPAAGAKVGGAKVGGGAARRP